MSFPWLDRTAPAPHGAERRAQVAAAELASRAGILYRLGFSESAAAKRLAAAVAWEYDPRPAALSDGAIAKIVADTYARRPG
ncbi:MAG TPA: hypothetical protein VGM88_30285 [Kofleriaceae bacterium]|jgi:hypothetical protein